MSSEPLSYTDSRGCFILFGIGFSMIAGVLMVGVLFGMFAGGDRTALEWIMLSVVLVILLVLEAAALALTLARRKVTVDPAAGTITHGWTLIVPITPREESLSDFGAVTVVASTGRMTGGSANARHAGPREQRTTFQVCLVRGDTESAAATAAEAGSRTALVASSLLIVTGKRDRKKAQEAAKVLAEATGLQLA